MIVSNIIGGLGNQMFQYAAARALSLRCSVPLKITIDQFKTYKLHNGFELERAFGLKLEEIQHDELKSILGWRSRPFVRRVFSNRHMNWAVGNNWIYDNDRFMFSSNNQCTRNMYMHGYWQSEKWFSQIEKVIRRDFRFINDCSPGEKEIASLMKMQPSVSVHVRRGDYLKTKNKSIYAECTFDYYNRAIDYIRKEIPSAKLFFFTDDPSYVADKFIPSFPNSVLVSRSEVGSAVNDMRLMASADHNIIANSTFSWWGAWLNQSLGKIVIAPKLWFTDINRSKDIIPNSWVSF